MTITPLFNQVKKFNTLITAGFFVTALGGFNVHFPNNQSGSVPVLLELFTSEGCSSCPPADVLLQTLDREQPVAGANLIVLSEHVDYWNRLGWTDPYSSSKFSRRQENYASRLNSDVYTPQLVVDGGRQVIGSNRTAVERAIKDSLGAMKIPVTVKAQRNGNTVKVHIEAAPLTGNRADGVLYLALAADDARSRVLRGRTRAGNSIT